MFEKKTTKHLTNLSDAERGIASEVVKRFPFLFIVDDALDVHNRKVDGYFALHTSEPRRDHGDVWAYYEELENEAQAPA